MRPKECLTCRNFTWDAKFDSLRNVSKIKMVGCIVLRLFTLGENTVTASIFFSDWWIALITSWSQARLHSGLASENCFSSLGAVGRGWLENQSFWGNSCRVFCSWTESCEIKPTRKGSVRPRGSAPGRAGEHFLKIVMKEMRIALIAPNHLSLQALLTPEHVGPGVVFL